MRKLPPLEREVARVQKVRAERHRQREVVIAIAARTKAERAAKERAAPEKIRFATRSRSRGERVRG